jgi:hypothetical protein
LRTSLIEVDGQDYVAYHDRPVAMVPGNEAAPVRGIDYGLAEQVSREVE